MYICIHVYMYECIHVYMYTCKHVYMYTCIHVYMYTCIHVYIYTCIHVQPARQQQQQQQGEPQGNHAPSVVPPAAPDAALPLLCQLLTVSCYLPRFPLPPLLRRPILADFDAFPENTKNVKQPRKYSSFVHFLRCQFNLANTTKHNKFEEGC